MNYPRIKKVSFIVVAILVVVGALLLSLKKPTIIENNANSIAISSATTTVASATFDYKKDSDIDGLPDWEETLWGTDPSKADSDGDKTNDGAEVKLGRNPLIKGPKDKLQDAPLTSGSATTTPLTETDKFGREIFARYMNLRQSGQSTNTDGKQQVVDDLLAASESIQGAQQYTSVDIKISPTMTLKEYGNAVASILQNNVVKSRNEAAILKEAIDKDTPELLKELDPLVVGYAMTLKQLIALKVPQTMAGTHLSLVNSMSNIVFTAKAFRNTFTDPIVSLKSLGQYQINAAEFPAILISIGQELNRQKITYSPTEAGYLFHSIQ